MPNFKDYDYSQSSMVVINYEDQLQPGTFEHAIHHLIEHKLDLSVFYPRYQNDEGGRPAYDPSILLKIILFAYSKGITSSREIQWCCEHNIIFKALSCDSVPHFTTIASFVSERGLEIEDIFEQTLLICDTQGLLGKELFAIDGCKMSSNAAKEHSGTFKELEEKRKKLKRQIRKKMKEHRQIDKKDEQNEQRIKRTKQTIDTLNKAHDKVDAFLKQASPRMGKGKIRKEVKSNITDNESCKMTTSKGTIQGYTGVATVDKKHQIIVDAQAFGEGQEHHLLQPVLEKVKERFNKLGISKNIYRKGVVVTADTGYANEGNMQYLHENKINGYIPDNQFRSRDANFNTQKSKYKKRHPKKKGKLIASTEFKFDAKQMTCTCPAGESMWLKQQMVDKYNNNKAYFVGKVSKCRECKLKSQCMRNPKTADQPSGMGRQVSFILKKNDKSPKFTDWMKHRVDSDEGKQIYSHRMSVVEPVFGNIGTNKRLNRFSLRSRSKVQGQWQMYCMVHNIEKLAKYGKIAA